MSNKHKIDWNIQLNFELPAPVVEATIPPPKPKIPPRVIIKERFPRILDKIQLLWGTIELHRYFQQTQFVDREKRQGFPPEIMEALGEIHREHQELLKQNGLLQMDVWDLQFREVVRKTRI